MPLIVQNPRRSQALFTLDCFTLSMTHISLLEGWTRLVQGRKIDAIHGGPSLNLSKSTTEVFLAPGLSLQLTTRISKKIQVSDIKAIILESIPSMPHVKRTKRKKVPRKERWPRRKDGPEPGSSTQKHPVAKMCSLCTHSVERFENVFHKPHN